jgi:hypothetical protein
MNTPRRIAMWSGPRNISTAMLRSWGSRADTFVCDEPLYAHYLKLTRLPHPGIDEVIAAQETDWQKVVDWLTGPVPENRPVFYQKHMTHHMLPNIKRDWLDQVTNAFLIRDPRDMIISLAKGLPKVRIEDTGLVQQLEIFDDVCNRNGSIPAVVDARDVQNHPEIILPKLCEAVDVAFDQAMLSWTAGTRSTDGIWAKYWYANVEKSTKFEPYHSKNEPVPPECQAILDDCIAIYDQMAIHRIQP